MGAMGSIHRRFDRQGASPASAGWRMMAIAPGRNGPGR